MKGTVETRVEQVLKTKSKLFGTIVNDADFKKKLLAALQSQLLDMDLRGAESAGVQMCFACRWAGQDMVLWPQKMASVDDDGQGSWAVYQKVEGELRYRNSAQTKLRSGHRTLNFCATHMLDLWDNWIDIASEEVKLHEAFHRYIEEVE